MYQTRLGAHFTELRSCPYCGRAQPIFQQVAVTGTVILGSGHGMGRRWAIYACNTCGDCILAQGPIQLAGDKSAAPQIESVLPDSRSAASEIPAIARRYLQQAYETLHAPDAATVMAASAVDAMLKEKQYTEGTLYKRIDAAVADHVLTSDMGAWAHAVRLEANSVRHADDSNPHATYDSAKQTVEFAEALGQFLFVLTARVTKGIADAKS